MAGREVALSFAFGFRGESAIGDDFGDVRAETLQRVGKLGTGKIAAREQDSLAGQLGGKFFG